MKKSIYTVLSFCLLLIAACKKKDLPVSDDSTSPVFYARCEINGLPVNLQAGANSYYMNSSYYQDTDSVYVYKAELKQKECGAVCGYAVTILINDSKVSTAGGTMDVSNGLKPGNYVFNSANMPPMYYIAKFTPVDPPAAGTTYTWDLGDGTTQAAYQASCTMDANRSYSVKFTAGLTGCSSMLTNVFNVGSALQTTVSASRSVLQPDIMSFHFSSLTTGQGPFHYNWDFGDGSAVSNDANPLHTYSKNGRYFVRLDLTDSQNNICVTRYQVSAVPETDCSSNYIAQFIPVKNTKALSAVTVLITDPTGKVYSSKDNVQPATNSVEVVSVDDYTNNSNGEPTKKIHLKFNCTLTNGGNPLVLKNGEAVIAVSYKQ